jgi:multiple sugar transport system substrate-binding protein
MFMEPPGFIPDLQAEEFPLAVLPVPVGDSGEPVSTGGIGLYAVVDVEDDAVEAAAHELGRWLTGAEVAEVVAGYQLAPSLRRSNTSYATDEIRETINALAAANVFEFPFAIPAELKANYYAALQATILGQQTAQEALDAIAPEYQAALDEANE